MWKATNYVYMYKSENVIDSVPIGKSFYGLQFSADEKYLFASGGHDNIIIKYAIKDKHLFNTDTFMSCYQTSFFCLRQGFVHPLVQGRCLFLPCFLIRFKNDCPNQAKCSCYLGALLNGQNGTYVPTQIC